jgi:hypothetical protein
MKNWRQRVVNATISAIIGCIILIIFSIIKNKEVDWKWVVGFAITTFLLDLIIKSPTIWRKKGDIRL